MAVFRVNKTENYTVISNIHLRDAELSLKAKGLLSQMLSLPPDWDYTVAGLAVISKEKESAITSALKELKKSGYLNVIKIMPTKENGGRIDYIYDIYEKPFQGVEIQGVEIQGVEIQGVEIQGVENQGQLNIDKLNIDKLNIDKLSTEEKNKDKTKIEKEKHIQLIADYLNQKAGTSFRATSKATHQHINARLQEGFTIDDFIKVIDKKCAEWRGTEWAQYLRPVTLFGTKFESYLNAPASKQKKIGQTGVAITTPDHDDLEGIL